MSIICGDALIKLKELPDESIDMVMTSPPYWALRDYGVPKQLGLEPTFQEYITKLCDIFDEVKRVLKKEGTCWVNLGDTYSNSGIGDKRNKWEREKGIVGNRRHANGHKTDMPDKCLLQIPSRFAIEMTNRGWILRNELVWWKPNCMPSSVKDRFTVDFEKLFFFVKSKKYYFEQQFEPLAVGSLEKARKDLDLRNKRGGTLQRKDSVVQQMKAESHLNSGKYLESIIQNMENRGRQKRAVWRITTKPYKEAHFAVYPEELCATPIKAGCPEGGIVLDPFFGSGTTGLVAQKLGRKWIGIELNEEYIKIAEERLRQKTLFHPPLGILKK